MVKRFTDTEKWFDPWFRELPIEYKSFWNFICDRCNNAGVWKIDMALVNFALGSAISLEKATELFGDRIAILRPGYWIIRAFIPFQFGDLSPANRMHASVLALLEKEGANKALKRPILRAYGNGKGQGNGKEAVREGMGGGFDFESLWSRYPRREGKKEAQRHFAASVKTPQDWLDIQNAIGNYIRQLQINHTTLEYTKMGSTWFNNWRDYVNYAVDASKVNRPLSVPPKPRAPEVPIPDLTHQDQLEIHADMVVSLKRCPSGPKCALCAEIIEGTKVVTDAMKKIAEGKRIEKSALEARA